MYDFLVIALAVLGGAMIGAPIGLLIGACCCAAANADRRERSETFQQ